MLVRKFALLLLVFVFTCSFYVVTAQAGQSSTSLTQLNSPELGICQDFGSQTSGDALLLAKGGNLKCFSDKKGRNKIWTGNSAHNCCTKKGGKSWSCPSVNRGKVIKCSVSKDFHCP